MHLSTSPLVLTALITLSSALVDAAPANNNGLTLGQVMQKYGLSPSTDAHRHGPKWSLDFSKVKGNNGNGNGHGNNGNGNGNGKGNNGKGNNGNNGNNGQGAAHRNAHAVKWDKVSQVRAQTLPFATIDSRFSSGSSKAGTPTKPTVSTWAAGWRLNPAMTPTSTTNSDVPGLPTNGLVAR